MKKNKEKKLIIKEFATNNRAERYVAAHRYCEFYQTWTLAKK